MILTASGGLVNNVRALVLLAGADINVIDDDYLDALAHAAENDHAVVRFLKSKGAMETVARAEKKH